ncbi:hypothetical protein [Nocardia sp. XZ_19_385]|uniref:hypothetical protein n=1 Tax=Nocardia sp. XZ_19_385 TaxID=2769488 RepID=UPI00188FD570|nr:hypothetical protein [Nocardia sp. XZ_19_385]
MFRIDYCWWTVQYSRMRTRHLMMVGVLAVSTFNSACGATASQEECTEPPTVEVVRNATGGTTDPVMIGAHHTCDGVIAEGLRLAPRYWPPNSPPLRGDGPLEVTVSPAVDRLDGGYFAKSGPSTGDQAAAHIEALGDGRFSVEAPATPGCWLLRMDVGVGWAVLVAVGDFEAPCPPPDVDFA